MHVIDWEIVSLALSLWVVGYGLGWMAGAEHVLSRNDRGAAKAGLWWRKDDHASNLR
jgi:hypothetical protein